MTGRCLVEEGSSGDAGRWGLFFLPAVHVALSLLIWKK
jgi:hypothetical protein